MLPVASTDQIELMMWKVAEKMVFAQQLCKMPLWHPMSKGDCTQKCWAKAGSGVVVSAMVEMLFQDQLVPDKGPTASLLALQVQNRKEKAYSG